MNLLGAIVGLALAGVVALFLAWQLRPDRSPIRAARLCDLIEANDMWGPPNPCGCRFEHGPGTDPAFVPCPAHQLLAEISDLADQEMSEGNPS